MSIEKLQNEILQLLLNFEDENNLITGCVLHIYSKDNQLNHYTFNGESFIISGENKQ